MTVVHSERIKKEYIQGDAVGLYFRSRRLQTSDWSKNTLHCQGTPQNIMFLEQISENVKLELFSHFTSFDAKFSVTVTVGTIIGRNHRAIIRRGA